jgi:hypothetical protein
MAQWARWIDRRCCLDHIKPLRRGGRLDETSKEVLMAIARVVTFEDIDSNRMAEIEQEMQSGDAPEGLEPQEIIVLHDPDASTSTVIIFFEDEDAYRRGDEVLNAMPASDTPGRRTSVAKYNVAFRQTM